MNKEMFNLSFQTKRKIAMSITMTSAVLSIVINFSKFREKLAKYFVTEDTVPHTSEVNLFVYDLLMLMFLYLQFDNIVIGLWINFIVQELGFLAAWGRIHWMMVAYNMMIGIAILIYFVNLILGSGIWILFIIVTVWLVFSVHFAHEIKLNKEL